MIAKLFRSELISCFGGGVNNKPEVSPNPKLTMAPKEPK